MRDVYVPNNQPLSLPEKLQGAATIPPHPAAVEAALIESIRNGIFFDRKYWARYSADVNLLRPVYFSSRIMGDKAQRLRECAWKFRSQSSESLRVCSGKAL